MDLLEIEGQKKLSGDVEISGSKNSSLPLLAASLLTPKTSKLLNVPNLADTRFMGDLLATFGAKIEREENCWQINCNSIEKSLAHYEMVRKMRASVLVLAPLLVRKGEACVSLPGGCAIGTRPVDLHLSGLEKLGATIKVEEGYIHAKLRGSNFKGCEHTLALPSVGASEQLVMAAVLADGVTVLRGVSKEPEVVDLCNALNEAGAKIKGVGSSTLEINGVGQIEGLAHRVKPDRVEAGTFVALAAATRSNICLKNVYLPDLENVLERFKKSGLSFSSKGHENSELCDLYIETPKKIIACDIETAPHPGFPTDMQAQFLAAMCTATGRSHIYERVFENRLMHVPELKRMGASIRVERGAAIVDGVESLSGAPVMATDLRASASLVIAALAAKGKSEIRRLYHLDRGYENLDSKLRKLGASVIRKIQ